MQLLSNTHISPDTAYLVSDYPYGFRLRCQIRYWIEYRPSHGFRVVSQTTNPKRPGIVWNKPKAGVYHRFGAALYLNDENHVCAAGLSEYSDGAESKAWSDKYRNGVPIAGLSALDQWVAAKVAYDGARAPLKTDGSIPDLCVGLEEAHKAWLDVALRDYQPKSEG